LDVGAGLRLRRGNQSCGAGDGRQVSRQASTMHRHPCWQQSADGGSNTGEPCTREASFRLPSDSRVALAQVQTVKLLFHRRSVRSNTQILTDGFSIQIALDNFQQIEIKQ